MDEVSAPPVTILVVEDNPITMKLVRLTLSAEGYTVLEAPDGGTARELLHAGTPDLVLLDLVLPDTSGFQLLREIRALPDGADIPVLAFTGFLPRDEEARGAAAGFTEFLVKPVEPSRLVRTIRTYVGTGPANAEQRGAGKRVLVVDDDPVQRKLARVHLERAGFGVDTAVDGLEALEAARRNPPDAILSDVLMPRLDGFKLCHAVRQDPRLRATPVVLQSHQYADEADRSLALRLGADAYLARSPDLREATDALFAALAAPPHRKTPGTIDDTYSEYLDRVVRQLERQAGSNAELAQQNAIHAAALAVLGSTADALARHHALADILRDSLYRCIDAAGLSVGVCYLARPEGGFRASTVVGFQDGAGSPVQACFGHPEILAQALSAGSPVLLPSPLPDEPTGDFLKRLGLKVALLVPILFREERLGVLLLASNARNVAAREWVGFAQVLSAQIGLAIALSRMVDDLRASEERYRLLFETNPLPAWVFDRETLGILAVNEAAVRHYGYTREEFLTLTIEQLRLAQDSPAPRLDPAPGRPEGVHAAGTWQHRRKDGTTIVVELIEHPLEFAGRFAQLVVVHDVTDGKRAGQLQLATYRISEAAHAAPTLQELYRAIHEIVGELMPAKNFYIALFDPAADTLSFPYFVDEHDPTPASRPLRKGLTEYVLRTGRPLHATPETHHELEQRGEVELIGAPSVDWFGVPLSTGGEPIGVLVVQSYTEGVRFGDREQAILQFVSTQVANAIQRKRAEDAVRNSEAVLRQFVEHTPAAVAMFDLDMRYLVASRRWYVDYRLGPADIIGRSHYEVFPEILEPWKDIHRRCLAGATERCEADPFTRSDGRIDWVRWEVRPWTRADGAIGGILIFSEVITERRLLEDQFRQAQKMEAVGRLAGGVAHDFNNLLTVITSYSTLLLDDLEATDPRREDLNEILKAATGAAGLTRQLLAFSRQQVLEPKVLDLNAVVAGAGKMLQRLIGEDVALVTVLAPDLASVKADPGQVEQVIMNLAVNSRDAMPQGGKLTIETMNVELGDAYTLDHPPVSPGAYVLLSVSDTGTGMDEPAKAHLFEPFFTTKEQGRGTGLGLATVYGIVKQSGGFVWVYSEPGHGTTFKIYLPRVHETPLAPLREGSPEAFRGTETILLAEDSAGVRAVAREVLQRNGYAVIQASDGRAALELAATHSGTIHLLVTDVIMPEMSGRQLADRLRDERPGLQVLFVSGYTDDAIIRHGILEPGIAFLQKPFTPEALARKVRAVLDERVPSR
jgi:PAS domain S-box-containing protein